MTARVTTLTGPTAGTYYLATSSYYLDDSEPPGRWHGLGAERLGLAGEVDEAAFLHVMAGHDPRTNGATHLGRRHGTRSVRGFDITASAPKSVSALFAIGDPNTRAAALAAHDTAVSAMIGWIESHAHTRMRIGGTIAVVDAEGIIAAAFRQHTSRALDPQLHTHVVIANRVLSPDGRWLALDARTLKLDQRTLSAVYHAVLRSELTNRLGVEWQPAVNGIAEMAHLPGAVLDAFSTRTAGMRRRLDVKLDRFVDTFQRGPTPRERWRLEREAALDSRPAKQHPDEATNLHDDWARQIGSLGLDPAEVVDIALDWVEPRSFDSPTLHAMIATAIDQISQRQSTWRPAELTRELAASIPTDIASDPSELVRIVDRLTDVAITHHCADISRPVPDGVTRRRDGRPVTESVADRALTTPAILAQEARLLAWAERRTGRPGIDSFAAIERSDVELTIPQAETAAAVAGDADLVLVVGPAGTGKTTALAPAVEQLRVERRPVFGVAPSAAAADVLANATGVDADTIDKLLTEHALRRPPESRFDLAAGATLIVDESGMVATDTLARLADLADRRRWRVALVGDPMQFSAIGRGGMFQHLVDTFQPIELDNVHRFSNEWERAASLRLRSGDATVADLYHAHGRLHGGTATRMERAALDDWHTARRRGESVVLGAPTNDTVTRLNHAAQQRRIDDGELDPGSRTIRAGSYRLHHGDHIVTRRNQRQLRTDRGITIRNRDHWTIETIHDDGSLTVHGRTGTARLPADYVGEHVELAYAQTSHATQGRTVDRSILVLDTPTDVRGIYVPLTRGRHHNHAYIVTTGELAAHDILAAAISRSWIDQPAHARRDQLARHQPAARPEPRAMEPDDHPPTTGTPPRVDRPTNERRIIDHQLEQHRVRLESQHARLRTAEEILARHDRPFRRRRHTVEIANATATVATLNAQIRHTHETISRLRAQATDLDARPRVDTGEVDPPRAWTLGLTGSALRRPITAERHRSKTIDLDEPDLGLEL